MGVTAKVPTLAGAAVAGSLGVPLTAAGGQHTHTMDKSVTTNHGDETNPTTMFGSKSRSDWRSWRERVPRARYPVDRSLMSEVVAFEIVKLGRELISLNKADRKSRKDTPPSEKTLADYAKKCRQIDREMDSLPDDEQEPLVTVIGRHAVKVKSFTAIKSALKWRAIERVKALLKSQDAVQIVSGRGAAWMGHVVSLYDALCGFIDIDSLDRYECLEFTGRSSERGRSKRADLPFLPQGWQDRFLDFTAQDPIYCNVAVLLVHCGLRPVELAKGVKLSLVDQGVAVEIMGGKVRAMAGQPWRSFLLDEKGLPSSFVQRLQVAGDMVVTADPDPLRAYLNRLSDKVFLQGAFRSKGARKKDYVLSAYTFRHSLVTELRQEGWDTASIAAVIGESSAKTVALYGIRSRKGPQPQTKVAIVSGSQRAARPVRAIDMQGLNNVQKGSKIAVGAKASTNP